MQFKSLAVVALSAGALAAPEKRQATETNVASVISVLQTAAPTSVALEFLTNSAGVYSSIASDLAASSTPSWIASLPTDVQSYLVGLAENPSAASSAIANVTGAGGAVVTSAPSVNVSAISGNVTSSLLATINSFNSSLSSAIVAGNGTAIANITGAATSSGSGSASGSASRTGSSGSGSTGSGSGSGSSSGSGSGSGSSSTSTGGASLPTALGMGLAGAVGLVGVFVL